MGLLQHGWPIERHDLRPSPIGTLNLRRCLRGLKNGTDALVAGLTDSGRLVEFAGDERLLPSRLPRRTSPVASAEHVHLDDGTRAVLAHQRVRGLHRAFGLIVLEPGLELARVFTHLGEVAEALEPVLLIDLEW